MGMVTLPFGLPNECSPSPEGGRLLSGKRKQKKEVGNSKLSLTFLGNVKSQNELRADLVETQSRRDGCTNVNMCPNCI